MKLMKRPTVAIAAAVILVAGAAIAYAYRMSLSECDADEYRQLSELLLQTPIPELKVALDAVDSAMQDGVVTRGEYAGIAARHARNPGGRQAAVSEGRDTSSLQVERHILYATLQSQRLYNRLKDEAITKSRQASERD